jgi:hypothetical protein
VKVPQAQLEASRTQLEDVQAGEGIPPRDKRI